LAILSDTGVIEITATVVIDCTVKENENKLLRVTGKWNIQRVIAKATLPFESN
jgi:hypothetical protein